MKMFLQTETPVSPAWSSDELSPQKASASGGDAAEGGDLVERNLFCDAVSYTHLTLPTIYSV